MFTCIRCGECCRHLEPFIEILPHQLNGICKFLQGDLCSIYENRPDLCDFKRAYKYLNNYFTESEYIENVIYFCEQLRSKKIKVKNVMKKANKIKMIHERPKNIPIYVPDCGWNHGEEAE